MAALRAPSAIPADVAPADSPIPLNGFEPMKTNTGRRQAAHFATQNHCVAGPARDRLRPKRDTR
jgi:hypothetical protein